MPSFEIHPLDGGLSSTGRIAHAFLGSDAQDAFQVQQSRNRMYSIHDRLVPGLENQRTNGPVNAHLRSAVYTNVIENSPSIGQMKPLDQFFFQNNQYKMTF